MPAIARCRLLVDPPAAGAWNMAVDEVLLTSGAETGLPTLRFYEWLQPTLSLGYFQKAADRQAHPASLGADLVRRLSGGGAILHDQELTYSLVLPRSHPLAHDAQAIYDAVHQTIAATLNHHLQAADSPWRAQLCRPSAESQPPQRDASSEPFLCFERRSVGDILLQNQLAAPSGRPPKIVGSAQRRRRGAVLQHGSILLGRSAVARELQGIAETTHLQLSSADLLRQLPERLAESLSLDLEAGALDTELALEANGLQQSKYGGTDWIKRR